MRNLRFSVAMSVDGFIAGPNGEHDWIVVDPEFDFAALTASFDTVLLGRKTWEAARQHGGGTMPGMTSYVVSRTLAPNDCPGATVARDPAALVASLKAQSGKDLWLFGGGSLFRSCLAQGLVDAVEIAIIPILLGEGVPLLPAPYGRFGLELRQHRVYEKTGTVWLEYVRPRSRAARPGAQERASGRSSRRR